MTKAHIDEMQDDLQVRIDIDNVTRVNGDYKQMRFLGSPGAQGVSWQWQSDESSHR